MVRSTKCCTVRLSKAWSRDRASQTQTLQPSLAGSRASLAHSAPQGGWVQDQAPQPRCQAETQKRTTYRRTISPRHARETGFAQRPLKTDNQHKQWSEPQNIGGRSFSDTVLVFPSSERLQRGESVSKAAVIAGSLLISVGRVVPASQDAAVLVPAPCVYRHGAAVGAQHWGMKHQAVSCQKAKCCTCLRTSCRIMLLCRRIIDNWSPTPAGMLWGTHQDAHCVLLSGSSANIQQLLL